MAMATPFHLPVTAAQVGTFFVGRYYQVLQSQPDFVHQFYSDASTMLRIDGHIRETATAMLQIHTLVMSLNYTGIEIKTAHSLESWTGGVLVLVSGSVHSKGFNGSRKFVQTFFLAPQENGFFVLNDIFHYIDEETIHHQPVPFLTHNGLDSKLNGLAAIREQVPNYMLSGEVQARVHMAPAVVEENDPVDNYGFQEQQLHEDPDADNIIEDNFAAQSNGSIQSSINPVQEHLSSPVEEPTGETQKHTYASILQVAKGQPAPSVPQQPSVMKNPTPASEWNQIVDPSTQHSFVQTTVERSGAEAPEDVSAAEDEVEIKSVYVKNVPTTATASEIEEEFKKFGKLKPDGVAIRSRKDLDVCYAFVEFEDITGVQNAIKSSTVEISGQQVYIEGRRPNKINTFRVGRGRGRGRGGYQNEGRGRFTSRNFVPRGNGYYRQAPRQERAYPSAHSTSWNGQNASD